MYILISIIHCIFILYNVNNFFSKRYIKINNKLFNKYKLYKKIFNNDEKDINKYILKKKYTKLAISYINFNKEKITIKTISNFNQINIIKEELSNILDNNLYKNFIKDKKYDLNKNKFIIEKILLYSNYINKLKKNKENFINLIINQKLKIKKSDFNINIYKISIKLKYIKNFNKNDILETIKILSKKYNINIFLILSIIKMESNFNNFSISKSGAIGLMQIVQKKSGIDVFKMLNKDFFPEIEYLLNFKNNLEIGIAYLFILKNKYLLKIKDKNSLRYIIISSYNAGINSVLNLFSKNHKNSINLINSIDSKKIYKFIINHHHSLEMKNYLIKVNNFYKKFNIKNNIKIYYE